MSSIIISSDDSATSVQVATQCAKTLGYDYLSTPYLAEVAKKQNISEEELQASVSGFRSNKRHYVREQEALLGHIRTAVLERFVQDSLVCQGLFAHLYVRKIPHILNVRVLADPKQRIHRYMEKHNCSIGKAERNLEKNERDRKRWSMMRFGIDEYNPSVYDIVFSQAHIDMNRIITTITDTIQDRKYQAMTYSRKCLADLIIESHIRTALIQQFPDTDVKVTNGSVVVQMKGFFTNRRKKVVEVKKLIEHISGVDYVEVRWTPMLFGSANA